MDPSVSPSPHLEAKPGGIGQDASLPISNPRQIAAQADNVSRLFPPVLFINFPASLPQGLQKKLQGNLQSLLDFRSWSSLRWWDGVFCQLPPSEDEWVQFKQSLLLVKYASEDMKKTLWLHQIKDSHSQRGIHMNPSRSYLTSQVTDAFKDLGEQSIVSLTPLVVNMIESFQYSPREYASRVFIAERHEYVSESNSIKSSIFTITCIVGGSPYKEREGLDGGILTLLYYDHLFRLDEWDEHSGKISDEEKDAMRKFLDQNTVNVSV
ncbi:uncharacterized protein N7446_005602 [Penicillium canescens]|uniref:Uncharacterized protein n=1 Tax=Penicillium canescens TaxID=5083 RepID=A0AAD6IJ12_PENCN|nr:uncharacterized protein N7446_005602 [Penicillium canescens]KAJ6050156.1 hypothetical protein N7444_006872 [Penicillium canescens]KAJ6050974.1 hypothetical protein N7460_001508 [Penicillium canescens]KAJ6061482.1 hypothetical protein N7446_005602 [Penicillium canescens]